MRGNNSEEAAAHSFLRDRANQFAPTERKLNTVSPAETWRKGWFFYSVVVGVLVGLLVVSAAASDGECNFDMVLLHSLLQCGFPALCFEWPRRKRRTWGRRDRELEIVFFNFVTISERGNRLWLLLLLLRLSTSIEWSIGHPHNKSSARLCHKKERSVWKMELWRKSGTSESRVG